jgi:hypothetical protein
MNVKLLILLVLFFFTCSDIKSQVYESELKSYLENLDSDSNMYSKGNLYIVNLLDNQKFDNNRKGIYKFGIIGPHEKPFLAFFNGKEMSIIKDYDPFIIIQKSIMFINEYETNLSSFEKATYLENISFVVKKNILPDGWELIKDEIIINPKQ